MCVSTFRAVSFFEMHNQKNMSLAKTCCFFPKRSWPAWQKCLNLADTSAITKKFCQKSGMNTFMSFKAFSWGDTLSYASFISKYPLKTFLMSTVFVKDHISHTLCSSRGIHSVVRSLGVFSYLFFCIGFMLQIEVAVNRDCFFCQILWSGAHVLKRE